MVPPQQQTQQMGAPSAAPQPAPVQNPLAAQPQNMAHHHHMMGFVSNPALAAAAAQAPLFPPPNIMNNPEALMGMPGMFAHHPPQNMQQQQTQAPGVMVPRMTTVMGTQPVANGFQPQQQQQQQQQYVQPGMQNMQQQQQQQQHAQIAPNNGQNMMPQGYQMQAPAGMTLGGVPIPSLPMHSSTAMQVQVAAAAAAAAAAPLKSQQQMMKREDSKSAAAAKAKKTDLSPSEKAKQNRDRNREHARSTRLRKKAYVQKLKELVEGLHAERTEEVRKRRVAIQHLSEVQGVRRAVVRSFLRFHSNYESDPRKWSTILEDDFWFKQPVTPYRSFRRAEVEQECRVSRGIDAMIADSASVSVMVEGIGSRSSRWMQLKREEILSQGEMRTGASHMHHSIGGNSSQLQHAVSSLSSSSGSSNACSSGGEEDKRRLALKQKAQLPVNPALETKKVSSSSGSSSESRRKPNSSNDFHDYHAQPLPDPRLGDSENSSPSDSPEESSGGNGGSGKHVSTDSSNSSSGDEDKVSDDANQPSAAKRRKGEDGQPQPVQGNGAPIPAPVAAPRSALPPNIAKKGGISHNIRPVTGPLRNGNNRLSVAPATPLPPFVGIGKKAAPAITLPPFVGLGKKAALPPPAAMAQPMVVAAAMMNPQQAPPAALPTLVPPNAQPTVHVAGPGPVTVSSASTNRDAVARVPSNAVARNGHAQTALGPSVIAPDSGDTSSSSSGNSQQIRAYYHVNEDDMLLTEDVIMCPYVFRSQDAVLCGALSECVMPGMLRANFSPRNKLLSLEMVYDAMGFMQQLERACGTDNLAQVVPGSLEMALAPNAHEARVITLAKAPFLIVSVNEAWTRTTKYTQMEVEGRDLSILNGTRTSAEALTRSGKPVHKFEDVAKGICACSTTIHYDKNGREFIDYVCSYPLTNANDDATHLLHVFKELTPPSSPSHEFPESASHGSDSSSHNQ